jgi:predicted Ser/Thr protein kinase
MTEESPGTAGGRELPSTLASTGGAGEGEGDLVGRVLGGRYRILRKLGEGAMGAVYLGEHLKIGRQDAIKVLRDALATDPDTIARFVRGTRNVSMIRHPNICTIYDYSDIAGGIQFVAMEFVPGETLRDLLQREGKLPLEMAVHVARQAAEALDAAHEVGIVHRDLKPANIMVVPGRSGTMEVKVVDFDIAKGSADGEGEEVTRMGFVVGTPEYMSPEQLIGDKLDGRSDIYSLALVLYRMLTGTLPFAAQDTQDLMVKRLTEEPMTLAAGLPSGVFPPQLEAAIRRALQRKPADRQATAGQFGREISTAIAPPATVGATRAHGIAGQLPEGGGAAPSGRERAQRVPMLVKAGGAGAVLVALAVAGVFAFGGGEGEVPPVATQLGPSQGSIVEYSDPLASARNGEEQGTVPEETTDPPARTAGPASEDEGSADPVPAAAPPPTDDKFLDLLERLAEPFPARSTLIGVRDTAMTAWDHPAATRLQRASAAYVVGSALVSLGDTASAITWLQRAVNMRPDFQPYRTELELYRDLLGGY